MDVFSSTMTGPAASSAATSSSVSTAGRPVVQAAATPGVGQGRLLPEEKTPAESSPPINPQQLGDLVEQANKAFATSSSNLKFSVAEGTDISIIRIEDAETGELIRQIPSEEMIAIARALDDLQQGMMLEERA